MPFNICKVKNISGSTKTFHGQEFTNNQEYTIQSNERIEWSIDSNILSEITADNLQVGDGDNYFNDYNEQIEWLKDNYNEITPTTPKNDHNLRGVKWSDTITVTETEIGSGIYKGSKTFKIESGTHTQVHIWGSKVKFKTYHEDDSIRFIITDEDDILGYGAGTELKQYADWYLSSEDGKIICDRPPSQSPGAILDGLYLKMELTSSEATNKKFWVNIIVTEKDGDEV